MNNSGIQLLYTRSRQTSTTSYSTTARIFIPDLLLNRPKPEFIPDPLTSYQCTSNTDHTPPLTS